MAEWKTVTIGDLCDTISNTYHGNDKKVILVNTSNVFDGKILNHTAVENKNLKGQFKKTFVKNDILYSEIRPANRRFAFVDFDDTTSYIASTKLMVLRPKIDKVLPEFLFAILKSKRVIDELQHLAETRSGTFPQITFHSELSQLVVKLPDFKTQMKIVAVLNSLENKINVNNSINDNLIKQAITIFNSNFAVRPKNGQLGDYCSVKSGFAFKSSWWTTSGIKVIKIGSINQDVIDLNDCSYVAPNKANFATDFTVKGGDLLIAMTGATIGKFAMVPQTSEILLVNQRVGRFFLGEKPIKKLPFIYCQLKQPEIANEIINRGQGSAQPNISALDIMTIPCVIPSAIEIDDFNEKTTPMFEKITQNQFENLQLIKIRDTLLPRLMSGEIDVSNIEI